MKIKKIIKIIISLFLIILCFCAIFSIFLIIEASKTTLNKDNLTNSIDNIIFYDTNETQITELSLVKGKNINKQLPEHVYNSFIAIEDHRFYEHKGIDFRRIAGAAINNLKSFSFKEGASTITQQLVKNTQLSSEKTIFRKVKEIKLAKDVEKQYTKQEILDMYLNVIYFGNSCYGIENASQYYFSKSAEDLTLNESAMFAAIIKAPSKLSPPNQNENLIKRKNLVLLKLKETNKISEEEYNSNLGKQIKFNINKVNIFDADDYIKLTLEEVADKLNIDIKNLKSKELKVFTYMDKEIQYTASKELKEEYKNLNNENYDISTLVLDNKSHGVSAISVKSNFNVTKMKRSPGSLIKPILVYAPAIEYNFISPATMILDEKTDFEGYNPSNYKDSYNGYVSARYSLSNSLNVPAVKILNMVGVEKAKVFARNFGIQFEKNDNGLGIALGGFSEGCTLLDIAGSYVPLANGGNFKHPSFIKKILDKNNKVIYEDTTLQSKVLSEETAFLVTDMLKSTIKNGTAKKLNSLNLNIAAKTGTVGNSEFNTDAYTAAYTSEYTFCTWIGATGKEKLSLNITGGNQPAKITSHLIKDIYNSRQNNDFIKPENIIECEIDLMNLNKYQSIKLAHEITPNRYKVKELFNKINAPNEVSPLFCNPQVDDFEINVKNNSINLKFKANEFINYKVERVELNSNKKSKVIAEIKNKNGLVKIDDSNVSGGKIYQYVITPYFENTKDKKVFKGTILTSKKCMLPYDFSPEIPNENDWWIEYEKSYTINKR